MAQTFLGRTAGDRPVASHARTDAPSDGVLAPPTLDLRHRPSVPNPIAGGMSTVYSASFDIDGKEVLLPLADAGRILSEKEALAKYKLTGQHLGIYASREAATRAAQQIHRDYEAGKYQERAFPSHLPEAEHQTWLREQRIDPRELAVYDFRAAHQAGATRDASGHWPSDFKYDFGDTPPRASDRRTHPSIVVGGFHTKTGARVPGSPLASGVAELIELGWAPETARQLWAKRGGKE